MRIDEKWVVERTNEDGTVKVTPPMTYSEAAAEHTRQSFTRDGWAKLETRRATNQGA